MRNYKFVIKEIPMKSIKYYENQKKCWQNKEFATLKGAQTFFKKHKLSNRHYCIYEIITVN